MSQLIDKGRVVVGVSQYQEKINGQPQFNQDQTPKMKTKWMTVGECTKWQGDDGSIYESEEIYLKPVSVSGDSYRQRRFWDSEQNNQAAQQQPHQGGWGHPEQPSNYPSR